MDLVKTLEKAQNEIDSRREEVEKLAATLSTREVEIDKKEIDLKAKEVEVSRLILQNDKKIGELKQLEAIVAGEEKRAELKYEADELMKKAQKMMEEATSKSLEAEEKLMGALAKEAKVKQAAAEYKEVVKKQIMDSFLGSLSKEA